MCLSKGPSGTAPSPHGPNEPAFTCQRLNRTTFVLEERDRWGEHPLIYAKVLPDTVVLIDTGCGGDAQTPGIQGTLRAHLETVPVPDNDDEPLNPGGARSYTIICSHCHYDHVGGIAEFTGTKSLRIYASALGQDLIQDPEHFPTSSLCAYVGMATPQYIVTHWAADGETITGSDGTDLGLVIYQTPGHTPDELAVWDRGERVLFVGDGAYEDGPVLFPNGGDVERYAASVAGLLRRVEAWNADGGPRVRVACGHNTRDADAESLLRECEGLVRHVVTGDVLGVDRSGEGYAWAGGQAVVEYRPQESRHGVYLQGLKAIFRIAGCHV